MRRCGTSPFGVWEIAVAGPVPPPHRAGVQAQGGELGDPTVGELLERIVVVVRGEHRAEAGDVLLVQLGDRRRHPIVAEAHPGRALADVVTGPPGVDGLLEQGDPRLRPQPLAEQQR